MRKKLRKKRKKKKPRKKRKIKNKLVKVNINQALLPNIGILKKELMLKDIKLKAKNLI